VSSSSSLPKVQRRYVHGLFCEQVRHETGGSQTFVGVFNPEVRVPGPFPVTFPVLAWVLWIVAPIEDEVGAIEARLHIPGGQPLSTPPIPPPALEPSPGLHRRIVSIVTQAFNVQVPEPGQLVLEAVVDGEASLAATMHVTEQQQP
jgi:hypothetical protein